MPFISFESEDDYKAAINKAVKEASKQFDGYMSPTDVEALKTAHKTALEEAAGKLKTLTDEKAGLLERVKTAEGTVLKGRVAAKYNIPAELADRLVGTTEEELAKDAESFASHLAPTPAPPLRSNDPGGPSGQDNNAVWSTLLTALTQE